MSSLRDVAEDYLRMRRALGYKLEIQGLLLGGFVSYLEEIDATTVTIENAVAWATSPAGADPSYWAGRLSVVRQFARHLQTLDPTCEVPPARLLPYRSPRAIPYLYQPAEITALLNAAGQLQPPLLAANYQTLIGLLSVTGLRLARRSVSIAPTSMTATSCCGSSTASSARTERSCCTTARCTPSPTMHGCATSVSCSRAATRSWSRSAPLVCARPAYITCLPGWSEPPVSHRARLGAAQGCTTSGMALLCGRCLSGTATVSMSKPSCRCSPHTWGIMRVILSSAAGLSGHGQPVGDRDGALCRAATESGCRGS